MNINGHLDLFSGIGGFSLALEKVGVKPNWVGFSDIDKYANELFQRRFKDAQKLGNITDVRCEDLPKNIDLLTGGFPCQPFSIAGSRLAFEDTRGTLFYEIVRILKFYIQEERAIEHFVLENVKGLYSAGTRTVFPTIYKILTDIGYSVECELLNSKYFGVPQNRERIYFVGRYIGNGSRPKVFPVRKNDKKIKNNGKEKDGKFQITNCSPREFGWRDESPTLCARDYKDPKWVKVHSTQTRSANRPSLTKKCDCKSGKLYQKCCGKGGGSGHLSKEDGTSYCLDRGNTQAVEIKVADYRNDEGLRIRKEFISPCLPARRTSETDPSTMPPLIVKSGALRTYPRTTKPDQDRKEGRSKRLEKRDDNVSNAVTTHNLDSVVVTNQIRRLTPIECERLQGFPDNWTDGQSDTQRYKQCGNAITVNVAEYVFRKLYNK